MTTSACPTQNHKIKVPKTRKNAIDYFEQAFWHYHQGDDPCMFLPSLLQLSKDLNYSVLDIQHALANLRKKGYNYYMLDIFSPITSWCPSHEFTG